jgi:hypothetical protein
LKMHPPVAAKNTYTALPEQVRISSGGIICYIEVSVPVKETMMGLWVIVDVLLNV